MPSFASDRILVVGDDYPFRLIGLHGADDEGSPPTPWDAATVDYRLVEQATDRVVSSGSMDADAEPGDFSATIPRAELGAYDDGTDTGLRIGYKYELTAVVDNAGARSSLTSQLVAARTRPAVGG